MAKDASVIQQLSDCWAGNKVGGSGHSFLNKNYCLSCVYCFDHSSWYCKVPKPEHQKIAKASDIMGSSQTSKPSWGMAGTNNNMNVQSWNYITKLVPTIPEGAVSASGCTIHLIKTSTPSKGETPTVTGLCVGISNDSVMQASHDVTLNLDHLLISFSTKTIVTSVLPNLVKNHFFLLGK